MPERVRQEGGLGPGAPVVEVVDAVVRLGGELVLDRASLSVGPGEAAVVVGPSGSGKSTLLRAIAGLLAPAIGSVQLWSGAKGRSKRVGITLDEPRLWPWMRAVDTVVTLAGLNGVSISKSQARAILEELDLGSAARMRVGELSQGMARRVQLAGALAVGSDLLLLDEPTASLDAESSAVVWSLLERRRVGGTPMVIATHDLSWANQLQAAAVLELDRR